MRITIAAALLAATVATPALAQDRADPRAPFTGARVEAIAGFDRVQGNGGHADGVVYGGQFGYDVQSNYGLLGIEGEVTGSTTRECVGAGTAFDTRDCLKAARDLYVGGRIGAVVGGTTLLYAKAGYTNARVRLTTDDGARTTTLDAQNLDGVRVGAGVEHAFGAGPVYGKVEYRYSNYEQDVVRHQVVAGVGIRF